MKVIVAGLAKAELAVYIRSHYRQDIQLVKSHPEFILCYGGDGTLLYAEQHYPGVPKVMIRHSRVCYSCARLARETILRRLVAGQYSLVEQPLLEGKIGQRTVYGLNDIIVAHAEINTSLRFILSLNGEQYGGEQLGDGLVVATPLGSTGYYQSITRSTFREGLGIAFNNTITMIGHLVVPADVVVNLRVTRGPALVAADNAKTMLTLAEGSSITIKRSHRSTHIVFFTGKHYRQYNIGLGDNRVPLGFCQICTRQF